ncbi:stAR-related lipid transfer protein 13-like isoform X3 [Corticium candelabrum]|nr:stAR-related lipid transfer protein 13-like isoform X3 [Corticium candelabrum]XP_062513643.1 stAR-related lipid transfer protein 13-like isoform X3 [Corticium candelabrum]XP_062513644.1 stAR-related lipid transfer protein 13-like isoform X3 [Corticium candelabrum]
MDSSSDTDEEDLHYETAGEESETTWYEAMSMGSGDLKECPEKPPIVKFGFKDMGKDPDNCEKLSLSSLSLKDMLSATERIIVRAASCSPVRKIANKKLSDRFAAIGTADGTDEAAVACTWLRDAGFPQYAQLYEAGEFPVDVTEADVRRDHDFLQNDELGALMRRLDILRRYTGLRSEDSKYDESEEEEEHHRAISNKWKFRKTKRQWWRRDRRKTSRQQSLRTQAIGRSLLAAKSSSSSDVRSPVVQPEGAIALTTACAAAVALTPTIGSTLSPSGSSTVSSASSDSIVLENSYVLEDGGHMADEDLMSTHDRMALADNLVASGINTSASTTSSGDQSNDSDFDSGACSGDKEETNESYEEAQVPRRRGSHLKWTQVVSADPGANDPEVAVSKEHTKPVVAKRKRIRWHSFQKQHRDSILVRSRTHSPISEMSTGKLTVLRKLALLKLTSMIERYASISADGHYSIGSVHRYIKKHLAKQPDYSRKKLFGVPLHVMVQRTGQPLPQTILYAMRYLRRTAITSVGLFRKAGLRAKIHQLRAINEDNPDNVHYADFSPYEVADMLKQYFRELPEKLFTYKLSESLILISAFVPREVQLQAMQAVMLLLPDENREALQSLVLFLKDIAEYSSKNKMTAENLAVCFAPSLFSLPGQGQRHSWDGSSKKPKHKSKGHVKAAKDMNDSAVHANNSLALMIKECDTLFTIPRDYHMYCRFTHLEEGDPVPYDELGNDVDGGGNYGRYIDSCVSALLKESSDRFRDWVHCISSDNTEISYKKVGDGLQLWLWRGVTEVATDSQQIMHRLLRERHLWDADIVKWRVIETLDEQSEVFEYSVHSMAPHPTRDYCTLRSWRTDLPNGARALVETSVTHPECNHTNGLTGTVLAARYLIEPLSPTRCRLTYITRIDSRGRSAEFYNNALGPYNAALVSRVRDSFVPSDSGMETEV